MHGGTVVANSEGEGFGTEFIVEIPMRRRSKHKKSLNTENENSDRRTLLSERSKNELLPVKEEPSDRNKDVDSQPSLSVQSSYLSSPSFQAARQTKPAHPKTSNFFGWWDRMFSNSKAQIHVVSTEQLEGMGKQANNPPPLAASTSSKYGSMSGKPVARNFLNYPVQLLSGSFMVTSPRIENVSSEADITSLQSDSTTLFRSSTEEAEDNSAIKLLTAHCREKIIESDVDGLEDIVDEEDYRISNDNRAWDCGLSILLVDDSDSNRKMCRRILSLPATPKSTISSASDKGSAPHRILEAKDGLDCLRVYDETISSPPLPLAAGQKSIDLVLMDDNMPGMLGYEAAKALRNRGYKGVIIGVTGDLYQETIDRFVNNGANEVMGKPLNISRLKERYSELVSK